MLGLGNLLSKGKVLGFPNKYSFNFDGSDDYLVTQSNVGISGSNAYTMNCWFKLDAYGSFPVIMSSGEIAGYKENSLLIRTDHNTVGWGNQAGANDFANASGTTISLDTWYMATLTFNGSDTIKIYINGALDGTKSVSSINITDSVLYVGKRVSGLQLDGCIDEVAIWNTELSASDVAKLGSKPLNLSKATSYDTDRTSNLKLWLRAGDKVLPEEDTSIARSDFYTDFDGTDDYVDAGTTMGTALGDNYAGSLTTCFWFKADVTSGDDGLFNIGSFSSSEGEWSISIVGDKLRFKLNNGGWKVELNPFTSKDWNHLACIYSTGSESNSKMYLNGESVGTASGTFPSASDIDLNGLKTILGGYYSSSYPLDGAISNVSIHQTALDAQTIKQFAKSRFTPMRDNRFSVVDFDGTNDYIDCGNDSSLNPSSAITISAWVYPETLDNYRYIVTRDVDGNGAYRMELGASNFYVAFGTGSAQSSISVAHGMSVNNWYHAVVTYDSTTAEVFVNGVSKGTASISRAMLQSSQPTKIGKPHDGTSSNYWDGSISSVSIYNVAKSAEEVYALYSKGITYDESSLSGLVGYWRMGDDTSRVYPTIADSSSNSNDGTITNGAVGDIVQQMVAGWDLGAFESSSEELGGDLTKGVGTMESGSGWSAFGGSPTIAYSTSKLYEGTQSIHITGATNGHGIQLGNQFGVISGERIYLSAWVYVVGGAYISMGMSGMTEALAKEFTPTADTWVNLTHTFTSNSTGSSYIGFFARDGNSEFYVDNVVANKVLQSEVSDTYPAIIDVNEPVLGAEILTTNVNTDWSAYGSNDVDTVTGGVKITHDDNAGGASRTIAGSSGKLYKVVFNAYYSGGTAPNVKVWTGAVNSGTQALTTSSTQHTIYFVNAGTSSLYFDSVNGSQEIYILNLSAKEIQGNVGTMTNQAADDLVYSSVLPDQSFLTGVNSAYNFIDLDGSNEYIDTGSPFESLFKQSFTLSAWVKIDDGQPSAINVIFSTVKQWSGYIYFQVEDDGRIKFVHGTHDAKELNTYTDSAVFADGASDWTHVAGVFSRSSATSGSVTIYVNGSSAGSSSSPVAGWNADNYDNNLYDVAIGTRNNQDSHDRFFSGDIGQTAIYSKALSASEISGINTLGRHGNLLDKYSEGLKAYYAMSSLDASTGLKDVGNGTIYDRSGQSNHGTGTNTESSDLASSPNATPHGYSSGDTNRSSSKP
jgi:hypothetical protein